MKQFYTACKNQIQDDADIELIFEYGIRQTRVKMQVPITLKAALQTCLDRVDKGLFGVFAGAKHLAKILGCLDKRLF
jgi:hypothetical protein